MALCRKYVHDVPNYNLTGPGPPTNLRNCKNSRSRPGYTGIFGTSGRSEVFTPLLHVPVLVGSHLAEPKDRVLAAEAVVVSLFPVVDTRVGRCALLRRGEFLKTRRHDGVEFLVLPPVSDYFVGVRADKVTF